MPSYDDGAMLATPAEPPVHLAILHRPGAAQSELRIGHVSVSRSDPDYPRLLVLNMVLGGQFVSRINMNLREKQGLHLRRAHELRRPPRPRPVRAPGERAVGRDRGRDARSVREIAAIRGDRPVTEEELDTAGPR